MAHKLDYIVGRIGNNIEIFILNMENHLKNVQNKKSVTRFTKNISSFYL